MNAPLLWFIVGVAFFVAELMTPAMVLLFFGVGAWASALAALLGMTLAWQIVAFICISLLTLLFLRRRLRTVFGGRSSRNPSANYDGQDCDGQDYTQCATHPLTGRQGVVSKTLRPGEMGEISIDGSFWRATAHEHLAAGSPVLVLGADPGNALVLRVQPVSVA